MDLDGSVLAQLKELQQRDKKSLGQLVSELLVTALADAAAPPPAALDWVAQPMGARVDLEDRDAVQRMLDGEP